MLPDKTSPAYGKAPSLLVPILGLIAVNAVNLYNVVKPVPSVFTANKVPFAELPPVNVVP